MKTCPHCKGKKKLTCTSYENGKKFSFKVNCYTCDGAGTVTPEQEASLKRMREAWCKCKKHGEPQYYSSSSGHGWTCSKCGKLLQTG